MFNLLPKIRLDRARKAEKAARAAYEVARAAYVEAYDRKDSRDKGTTWARLNDAAGVLLKAENASRDLARSISARTPKSARPFAALAVKGR